MVIYFIYSLLTELNLPAAIEDTGGDSIPQSLLEKSTSLRNEGGVQKIDNMFNELPTLLQRNQEILNEVCHILNIIFSLCAIYI